MIRAISRPDDVDLICKDNIVARTLHVPLADCSMPLALKPKTWNALIILHARVQLLGPLGPRLRSAVSMSGYAHPQLQVYQVYLDGKLRLLLLYGNLLAGSTCS